VPIAVITVPIAVALIFMSVCSRCRKDEASHNDGKHRRAQSLPDEQPHGEGLQLAEIERQSRLSYGSERTQIDATYLGRPHGM
jgi:hypothetical protein